jgi:hypothetical protein
MNKTDKLIFKIWAGVTLLIWIIGFVIFAEEIADPNRDAGFELFLYGLFWWLWIVVEILQWLLILMGSLFQLLAEFILTLKGK